MAPAEDQDHRGSVDGECRVVVVDDHPRARQALSDVVETTPGLTLAACLHSGEQAVDYAARCTSPLLFLIDVRMPGVGGVDAARIIADGARGHVVVLVSTDEDAALTLPQDLDATFISKSQVTGESLLAAWRRGQRR